MDDIFTFDKNNDSESNSDSDVEEEEEEDVDDVETDDDEDEDIAFLNPCNVKIRKDEPEVKKSKAGSFEIDFKEFERDMGWSGKPRKKAPKIDKAISSLIQEVAPVKGVLKKSVIKAGFERLKRVPKYDTSDKKLKLARKRQREKTKGDKWYGLPATEMTDEVRHDLEIIQKRSALDPKHFYKRNDMKVLPKYFHIGKVVDSPLDYYNGRMTKKERKHTIVEELMADAEFSKYNKRKYKEIIEEKKKTHYKTHQRAKKMKRKKKN